MQRVFFAKTGNPVEVLQYTDTAPIPDPAQGELRIHVTARPINPSDLLFIRGQYGLKPDLPAWPGFEGAGVVEALGPEVEGPPVGTRVAFSALGTWQEYVVVPARSVIAVPDSLSDVVACQLYVNPFTAWALLHTSGLQTGDWVLLSAGASAFAQLFTQLAASRGIRVISTVRRDDHRAHLYELGAHAVINTETEPLAESVREITQGAGVRVGLEAVGGAITQQLLDCLMPGGTLLVYGLLSMAPTTLNLGTLIFRQLRVQGFWLSEWLHQAPKEVRRQAQTELLALLQAGTLHVPIEAEYELPEVHNAVMHAELEGRVGKIILVS